MKLKSDSFEDNARIPAEYAFCAFDPGPDHVKLGGNRNPHLEWGDLPMGTRSLVLICHDVNVPCVPDDVNKEGRTIAASLPRLDFYHWLLVELDPHSGAIQAGEFSNGVTARGKNGPHGPRGTRQGINDYTAWFANTPEMKGDYYGYDGPCPPWNDSIVHHYVFTLYAIDLERLPVTGTFRGADVVNAMRGHVLEEARITGLYSLNPQVAA
jgi:Raf kinase inhibitor-like YbhB/YbcL family protein